MDQNNDKPAVATRLQSLDALRGLDMLFLVGISGVIVALGKTWDNSVIQLLAGQMRHTPWQGFHVLDLVEPEDLVVATNKRKRNAAIAASIRRASRHNPF